MNLQFSSILCVGTALFLQGIAANAAGEGQTVQLPNSVTIPGASLAAGPYTFSVEDRLTDRAIVRITDGNDPSKHYLLLTVPSTNPLSADANGMVFFTSAKDHSQSLRAWKCANCPSALEFVYPKLEAVKITGDSAQSVLAVDPEYDKLPPNLTEDDMKVVTLWLLAPKTISNGTGEGVSAEKLAAAKQSVTTQTADATTAPASRAPARRHLPKTASHTFSFLFYGMMLLAAAAGLRLRKGVKAES